MCCFSCVANVSGPEVGAERVCIILGVPEKWQGNSPRALGPSDIRAGARPARRGGQWTHPARGDGNHETALMAITPGKRRALAPLRAAQRASCRRPP
eukprot:6083756-Pyramimonas_sp.AAC.1